jgi:hypothetical protein
MTDYEEQAAQICLDYLTPQELRLSGSTETAGEHFYTPGIIIDDPTLLSDVNQERLRAGYIRASMMVTGLGIGNPRTEYAVDLPPIDPHTQSSRYDPSIWEVTQEENGATAYVVQQEMTEAVYQEAEKYTDFELHHRDGMWKWEVEAKTVEGTMRPSPEGMQGRK